MNSGSVVVISEKQSGWCEDSLNTGPKSTADIPLTISNAVKNITQLLGSDDRLHSDSSIKFDSTSLVQTPSPTDSSVRVKTFVNSNSKSWQGGTITVLESSREPIAVPGIIVPEEARNSFDTVFPEPAVVRGNMTTRKLRPRRIVPGVGEVDRYRSEKENYDSIVVRPIAAGGRKGGRGSTREEDMSSEERERLKVRRLRNKEAAARCRKRRVDRTNDLQQQVDCWRDKKRILEDEITQLRAQRDKIQLILEKHICEDVLCRISGNSESCSERIYRSESNLCTGGVDAIRRSLEPVAVETKSEVMEPASYLLPDNVMLSPTIKVESQTPPPSTSPPLHWMDMEGKALERPSTLGFNKSVQTVSNNFVPEGVIIETPSNIVPCLNFDDLTSTGLTPVATLVSFSDVIIPCTTHNLSTPTCSTQLRSAQYGTVSSPDGVSMVSL